MCKYFNLASVCFSFFYFYLPLFVSLLSLLMSFPLLIYFIHSSLLPPSLSPLRPPLTLLPPSIALSVILNVFFFILAFSAYTSSSSLLSLAPICLTLYNVVTFLPCLISTCLSFSIHFHYFSPSFPFYFTFLIFSPQFSSSTLLCYHLSQSTNSASSNSIF